MATRLDFRNDNEADERLNPASSLRSQETNPDAYDSAFNNDSSSYGNDTEDSQTDANNSKNIADTREREQAGPWKSNVTKPEAPKKEGPTVFKGKKKGPLGLIATLLGGGTMVGVALSAPATLLFQLKAVVLDKLDSVSNVINARGEALLQDRMFTTTGGKLCTIKIRCRYSGLNEEQMSRLRLQGAELLDASGKPVVADSSGKYTGGKTLVLEDGSRVTATSFKGSLRSNEKLRDLTRAVFNPTFNGIGGGNEEVVKLRAQDKLDTNGVNGASEEETRKSLYEATAGDPLNAETQGPSAQDQYTTDQNGNQVPKNPNQTNIQGMGDFTDAVNTEAQQLQTPSVAITTPALPADPALAAMMPESPASVSLGKRIVDLFNPTSILVGMCGTYKISSTIVTVARTIVMLETIRFAISLFSEIDKLKAGEGTAGEAEQTANLFESPDAVGDTAGDSGSYQWLTSGVLSDKVLTSTALGGGVVMILAAVLHWVNKTAGFGNAHAGKKLIKTSCNILENPFVQGALAITSFIPGGGQIAGVLKSIVSTSAKAFAETTIKDAVTNLVKAAAQKVASNLTKDALKSAAKTATKEFLKMAGGAAGIFLASYLTERYAIPYLARAAVGAILPTDGVQAMDMMANGYDGYNQKVAQGSGLAPLTPKQAYAFNQFNTDATATYVADMRSESNPFDLTNPYSAGNSLASAFYSFTSKLMNSSVLGAPAAILSSFNPGLAFASNTALADPNSNGNYEMCQQDDFISSTGLATTPFCNIQMGSNDVNMLVNADPATDVMPWMMSHNQIDGNGDPVAGSDYEWYKQNCAVVDKDMVDVGDSPMDPKCYDTSVTSSTEWKYFYLYTVDRGNLDNSDNQQASTSSNPSDATPTYIAAGTIPQNGMVVGASVFGGALQNGQWVQNLADNGGNDLGNHGNHMTGTAAYAELGNGTALGNLPNGTRLAITYNGKTVIAEKADIGAGGSDVNGHTRAVDLWWQTANALGFTDNGGLGVVTIHAVDPATPLTQIAAIINPMLKNIGFTLNSLLSDYRPFMSYARGAF